MKLNKEYVLGKLQEQFAEKYTKAELREIVNTLLEIVANVFRENGRLTIAPLGTFFNRVRKARTMKHPSNGEIVEVKEGFTPAFKPSVTMKRTVNS
jgi:nucleoid DNA-binding protein